jgi:low temperature requirement protein LtrA
MYSIRTHLSTGGCAVDWFQPPQLRIGEGIEEESRRATWLELFFDLVFVVAVSQVAHYLRDHVSIMGVLGYVALFLPLWWAWIGATFYANRFDVDDIGHRLLTGVQMLGIAAMAVNVHQGLGASSIGYALSYVLVRIILIFQYLRAAWHIPSARSLALWYAIGFSIAALLWIGSIAVPMPLRFGLWGLGLIVDFATPVTATRLQSRFFPQLEHMPERFGLFVIIVLGEAIIAVVNGVANEQWQPLSVLAALFGFTIAFSLWWIYFENVGSSALRLASAEGRTDILQVWLFGHLPLVLGIAATGVAVERMIVSEPALPLSAIDRWLLCGAVAMCLVSLAILHRTGVIFRCKVRSKYRLWSAMALVGLAALGTQLPPIAVVGCVAAVAVFQVAQDLYQGHPTPKPPQEIGIEEMHS